MIGYKVFNSDFTCRGFQFEEGKEYVYKGAIKICSSGFHFCTKANDCFEYYPFDSNNIVCEVEALGEVQTHDDDSKACTNHIRIIRKLTWHEVLDVVNIGKGNTGRGNTGDWNTGDRNTGNSNTGDWNTGDWNTGNSNTGYSNTGNRNTGNRNTGYRNTGYSNTGNSNTGYSNTGDWNTGNRNTGYSNTGDSNTGYRNTGNRNTGYSNTGDWNTGNRNTGYSNTGDWNTGNSNTGDWNTGNSNTGDWNTGDWNTGNSNTGYSNTGDWNTGDWNTGNSNTGYSNTGNRNAGAFCTGEEKIKLFNKYSNWTIEDFENSMAFYLLKNYVETKQWVHSYQMTDEEKQAYPSHRTAEGYLKDISFKDSFKNAWHNWSEENRKAFTSLPNFCPKIFFEITGVEVSE